MLENALPHSKTSEYPDEQNAKNALNELTLSKYFFIY
jgi:hypothetical protein